MKNEAIRIEHILVSAWTEDWGKAGILCANLQKEINKKCPEGYKYKETISCDKDKDNNWLEVIVIYEQIPR